MNYKQFWQAVTEFKHNPFINPFIPVITALKNTEIATVVEFKGLILATTIWYENFADFHFRDMYVLQFSK